jgi:hypothetical protein
MSTLLLFKISHPECSAAKPKGAIEAQSPISMNRINTIPKETNINYEPLKNLYPKSPSTPILTQNLWFSTK